MLTDKSGSRREARQRRLRRIENRSTAPRPLAVSASDFRVTDSPNRILPALAPGALPPSLASENRFRGLISPGWRARGATSGAPAEFSGGCPACQQLV
ncbi:hypothetical protein Zmor_000082 [Zophobas morio]|uniref:Uncharacterized protein n=1 Tax=Zophobas morio TaxID=2755281 RepID=A0AA38MR80_9CUCU|nr:hypothetical protein Zmor_000082 [Zophobas morio]